MNQNEIQNPAFPLPQIDEITKREREDAMGAYFMTFASLAMGAPLPLLSLLVSFIYHLVNARKSRFVAFHSLQSLLAELPVSVLNAVLVIWGAVLLFGGASSNYAGMHLQSFWYLLIFTLIVNVIYITFSLIAAFRAQKGRFMYFWLIGAFAYRHYYVLGKGLAKSGRDDVNLPPPGF